MKILLQGYLSCQYELGITLLKSWLELSPLVSRCRSSHCTSVLTYKLKALIVFEGWFAIFFVNCNAISRILHPLSFQYSNFKLVWRVYSWTRSFDISWYEMTTNVRYRLIASIEPWRLPSSKHRQCCRVLLCVDNGGFL